MSNVNLLARVMHKGEIREFRTNNAETGCVSTLLVSDETGQVQLSLWDDKAYFTNHIKIGNAILIEKAYTKEKFGKVSLNLDADGSLTLNPNIAGIQELPIYEDRTVGIADLKTLNEMVIVEGTVATPPIIKEVETSKREKVKLATFELADITGRIEVALWRELADLAENLSMNERIRIRHIYVKQGTSGRLRLSSSSLTSLTKL